MFYDGDLQSGINLAVSQDKLVGCFVHDDSETSKTWEEDFLTNDDLPTLLEEKVVLLRLKEGSQEAGFLSQMYPIYQVPTFVVLGGGLLKVYISSNPPVTKEDFTRRVKAALVQNPQPEASDAASSQPTAITPQQTSTQTSTTPNPPIQSSNEPPETSNPEAQASNQPSNTTTSQAQSSNQQLFNERAQKLSADKKAKEEAAKAEAAEKAAKAKAAKEAYEAGNPVDPKKKANLEYAKLRNERLKKERDDLAMIRKRVQDDKIERKNRELERKERDRTFNIGAGEGGLNSESSTTMPGANLVTRPDKSSGTTVQACAIQIRLFDGSTMRNRFSATSTLTTDVRRWVSEHHRKQSEREIPYTFKQVLTPLPNRTIETSEESLSLKELGFVPSTTLVLVPAKGVVDAYASGGIGGNGRRGVLGWLTRLITAVFGLVGMVFAMVTGFLGAMLPSSSAQTPVTRISEVEAARAGENEREEKRKKRDEKREFYNGNNLSFEPRRDEDDGEENS